MCRTVGVRVLEMPLSLECWSPQARIVRVPWRRSSPVAPAIGVVEQAGRGLRLERQTEEACIFSLYHFQDFLHDAPFDHAEHPQICGCPCDRCLLRTGRYLLCAPGTLCQTPEIDHRELAL